MLSLQHPSIKATTATISSPTIPMRTPVVRRIKPLRIINDGDFATTAPEGVENGTLWAAIYVFDDSQEMRSCCACQITSDGLLSESVNKELTANEIHRQRGNDPWRYQGRLICISPDPRPPLSGDRDCGDGQRTFRQRRPPFLPPSPGEPCKRQMGGRGHGSLPEDSVSRFESHGSSKLGNLGIPVFLWANPTWQRLRTPAPARRKTTTFSHPA